MEAERNAIEQDVKKKKPEIVETMQKAKEEGETSRAALKEEEEKRKEKKRAEGEKKKAERDSSNIEWESEMRGFGYESLTESSSSEEEQILEVKEMFLRTSRQYVSPPAEKLV